MPLSDKPSSLYEQFLNRMLNEEDISTKLQDKLLSQSSQQSSFSFANSEGYRNYEDKEN